MTEFGNWIDENGGLKKTAIILSVKKRTLYSWITGARIPRPDQQLKIFKESNGKVDFNDIAKNFLNKRERKRLH